MSSFPEGALLVRIPNWLGDLVLALPTLEAVAAQSGERPVLLVGPEPFAPLFGPRFPSLRYIAWSRSRRWVPLGPLRRARPETALLLTDSLGSAILAFLAGCRRRIGYDAEGRGFLLTERVRRAGPARTAPRAEEYATLARAAGLAVSDTVPRLTALPGEIERATTLLRARGLSGAVYAAIAPGASYGPAKRWEASRFSEVAARLRARRGLRPVVLGSEEDRAAAGAVAAGAGDDAIDIAGATDLPALVGVLAGAALVLSNDSGVMHLAAALGRPTVAIFGSTSPAWTSGSAAWVRNLYAAYPCSPCFRRTCPIGYGCLRTIGAEEAARAAEMLLLGATNPNQNSTS